MRIHDVALQALLLLVSGSCLSIVVAEPPLAIKLAEECTRTQWLPRQAHAVKQVFEARVRMERVEDGCYVDEDKELRMFVVGISEHFESVVIVAQPDVDHS